MLNKYREQRREEEESSEEWALKEIKCNWTLLVIKVLYQFSYVQCVDLSSI